MSDDKPKVSASRRRLRDPARARADGGEAIEKAPDPAHLETADVPPHESAHRRVSWIAERIAAGLWSPNSVPAIAQAWNVTPRTVVNYATTAATVVQISTGDIERIRRLSATRIMRLAGDTEIHPGVQLEASKTMLQLTGDLKGGRERIDLSPDELKAQITQSIREPDELMLGCLRAAFQEPGAALRGLLVEFATVDAAGEQVDG